MARFEIAGLAATTLQRAFGEEAKNAEAPLSVANQANQSSIVSAQRSGFDREEPTKSRYDADDCKHLICEHFASWGVY